MRPTGYLAMGIAMVFLVLVGCGETDSAEAPAPEPTFQSVACEPAVLPAGQDPANVTCGFLTVAENRGRFSGRTIRLATVVLHATGDDPEPDPLVMLSGGPGQWAIASVLPLLTADFAAPIQAKRDLVIFDQRGTGRSQPALNCRPEILTYREALGALHTPEEEADIDAQNYLDCRDRLGREGHDLIAYSSAATAQDIADLMTVLGYDRFNIYGLSYGTRVALTALRDTTDDRIRSVVLDSVFPPQIAGPRTGSAVERAFDLMIADCAADADCNRAYPNLRQTTYDLIEQLNATPLELNPSDPLTGEPFHVIVTGDRLVRLSESAFQVASLIPFLPLFTTSTAAGNPALLTVALAQVGLPELYSPGLQAAVMCNEEVAFYDAEAIEMARAQVDPVIAHAFAFPDALMRACPQWDVPALDPVEDEPVQSDVPALILAGEYDTATPPSFSRLAAETLPNSSYFEFRGLGHVVLSQQATPTGPPACAMRIMAEFLDDPLREPDGSCAAALPPPQFIVP